MPPPPSPVEPASLARIRSDMLRFARLQLGNDDEAEDVVQEALAGALKNAASFRGEAALKTWMIAILKNKIADMLRRRQRGPVNASQFSGCARFERQLPLLGEAARHHAGGGDDGSDV